MQHGPGTQDPDEEVEQDDDLDENEPDYHDGDGPMTDFCDMSVKVGDSEVRISAQDPEIALDLFKVALAGVATLRGSDTH